MISISQAYPKVEVVAYETLGKVKVVLSTMNYSCGSMSQYAVQLATVEAHEEIPASTEQLKSLDAAVIAASKLAKS